MNLRFVNEHERVSVADSFIPGYGELITSHKEGKEISVFATESRPRWQGHLTIKQLDEVEIKMQKQL